jgi:hypothetical protein
VETLHHHDSLQRALPADVKRLPMAGRTDVMKRLRALRDAAFAHAHGASTARTIIHEAVEVFTAAWRRLRVLHNSKEEAVTE